MPTSRRLWQGKHSDEEIFRLLRTPFRRSAPSSIPRTDNVPRLACAASPFHRLFSPRQSSFHQTLSLSLFLLIVLFLRINDDKMKKKELHQVVVEKIFCIAPLFRKLSRPAFHADFSRGSTQNRERKKKIQANLLPVIKPLFSTPAAPHLRWKTSSFFCWKNFFLFLLGTRNKAEDKLRGEKCAMMVSLYSPEYR